MREFEVVTSKVSSISAACTVSSSKQRIPVGFLILFNLGGAEGVLPRAFLIM